MTIGPPCAETITVACILPIYQYKPCPLSSWAASLCKGECPITRMSSVRLEPLQKSLLMGKGGPFQPEILHIFRWPHMIRGTPTTIEGAEGKVFLFLFLRSAEAVH